MVDSYAWFSIIGLTIALIIMINVFYRQYLLTKTKSNVQSIKYVLMFLVAIILFNHAWSIITNFYRGEDGNLETNVRHLSDLFNTISALATAVGWRILYHKDK